MAFLFSLSRVKLVIEKVKITASIIDMIVGLMCAFLIVEKEHDVTTVIVNICVIFAGS